MASKVQPKRGVNTKPHSRNAVNQRQNTKPKNRQTKVNLIFDEKARKYVSQILLCNMVIH
jgi:ribosomal RNA-processing protein 17